MSEIKHTPGPWNAKHNGQYWEIRGPEIGYFSEQIGNACASEFIGGMKANPVSEANACVIAAAPELLELVEMVHRSFGGGKVITFSDSDIERFAEVFAKATGGAA